ncbi:helix-turn-helix domain-containing protein [Sorangium sp. So ce367]|uniref:helix-turn-helix domain-containing protein n=1 Tax=Sorangium sp. So ce367 TaxID=3133305 RepID=UPI003F5DA3B0
MTSPQVNACGVPDGAVVYKYLLVERSEQRGDPRLQGPPGVEAGGDPASLEGGPARSREIAVEVEVSQQAASQHLAVLEKAGLVEARKEGLDKKWPDVSKTRARERHGGAGRGDRRSSPRRNHAQVSVFAASAARWRWRETLARPDASNVRQVQRVEGEVPEEPA